jgi:AcrR family transcriptional regulator
MREAIMVQAETQGKKERILAAAEEVFSKRGYTQSTLDEIIKIADTGKGTVYKYFGNKENLFYILVHAKHEKLMSNLWAIAHSKSEMEAKISTFLDAWVQFLVNNTVLWQVLMFEMTGGNRGITAFFDGELSS